MNTLHEHANGILVNIEGVFEKYDEAVRAIDAYEARFLPEGYGTVLTIREYKGGYVVGGHRQASCD